MDAKMKRTCRHCHEDLTHVPPTAAMTRHITGLCAPSRNDAGIAQLEIDEEEKRRSRRAIQIVNENRGPMVLTGKDMLKLFVAVLLGSAFVAYLLFAGPILEWVRSVFQ